jgi:hypothetical protein
MSGGGVYYLNTVATLMQNWVYVYSVLLDFMDNSIVCIYIFKDPISQEEV